MRKKQTRSERESVPAQPWRWLLRDVCCCWRYCCCWRCEENKKENPSGYNGIPSCSLLYLSDVRYGLRMEYGFRDFFLVSVDHPNPAHERGFFFIFYFLLLSLLFHNF
jgi:hypothetical protein